MKIVYLAGAISGVDDYADKFRFWESVEREKGNIVLNPAKLPEGIPYESYMPICLAMIMAADEVAILPYSDTSIGVAAEKAFAAAMGKKIRRHVKRIAGKRGRKRRFYSGDENAGMLRRMHYVRLQF